MKLHVKADRVTPASLREVVHIEWADRRHGSEVQIKLRLAQAKLCLEQRPGLSQTSTKVHRALRTKIERSVEVDRPAMAHSAKVVLPRI
jgi:hypothetical protein